MIDHLFPVILRLVGFGSRTIFECFKMSRNVKVLRVSMNTHIVRCRILDALAQRQFRYVCDFYILSLLIMFLMFISILFDPRDFIFLRPCMYYGVCFSRCIFLILVDIISCILLQCVSNSYSVSGIDAFLS